MSNSVNVLIRLATQWIVVTTNMTVTTQSSIVAGNFRDPFRLRYHTIYLSAQEQTNAEVTWPTHLRTITERNTQVKKTPVKTYVSMRCYHNPSATASPYKPVVSSTSAT